ncbi:MAG TPA: hypothetical protein VGB73_20295 [Pyrinomonadaceae bacterium]
MIAKLNLASQPFRNRTLPWTISVVVACTSLLALVFIVAESRQTKTQADRVEVDVQALRKERATLQAQASEVRESVPPDQLRVLEAAHTLVDRKRFSWSRLLADLESALPASVRVSRINVRDVSRVGGQTRADLDLVVVGRTPFDVTKMISEMNRGGTFSVVPVSENQKTGRGESGFEWTLRVGYVQRTVAAKGDSEQESASRVAPERETVSVRTSNAEAEQD